MKSSVYIFTIIFVLMSNIINGQDKNCLADFKWYPLETFRYDGHTYYQFVTSADTTGASFIWKFGDGTYAYEATPMHVFAESGQYAISLEITNKDGNYCYGTRNGEFTGDRTPECSVRGVVRDLNKIDGCGYVIETEDGELILPYLVDSNFVFREGMKVKLSYTYLKMMTTCMAGANPAAISCITEVDPDDNNFGCFVNFKAFLSEKSIDSNSSLPYTFVPSASEEIAKITWKFGDYAFSQELNPTHYYSTLSNIYDVNLSVITKSGCTAEKNMQIFVGEPVKECTVDFKYEVLESYPLQFAFKPITNDDVLAYFWDFGDGATSEEAKPIHTFSDQKIYDKPFDTLNVEPEGKLVMPIMPKKYNVCLNITTTNGCNSKVCKIIDEGNPYQNCWCSFEMEINPIDSRPNAYKFVPYSSGKILECYWDFGDGSTSTQLKPTHSFMADGYYDISLTTITNDSCKSSWNSNIYIGQKNQDCKNSVIFAIITNSEPNTCDGQVKASFTDYWGNYVEAKSYFWNNGVNSQILTGICPNTLYSLVVNDVAGCQTFGSFIIFDQNSTINLKDSNWVWYRNASELMFDFAVPPDVMRGLGKNLNVIWDFGDGNTSKGEKVTHNFQQPGNYDVTINVTDDSGNILYKQFINLEAVTTSIKPSESESSIVIHPNPVKDILTIEIKEIDNQQIEIFDVIGNTILSEKLLQNINNFDVNHFPSGLYLVKIKNKNSTSKNLKFIKQ